MKAAPEDQILLLDLQRLDNDTTRIAHRIAALQKGESLSAGAARAAELRAQLVVATGELEDAERETARLESDTATAQARVDRDRALLQTTSNPKDAAGLEAELANLARRIGELETTELEIMERVEGLQANVEGIEALLAGVDEEQRRLGAERDADIATLTTEQQDVAASRAALASRVPDELLALYERQRGRYGFGASLLQGGVSTASGVTLTGADLATIRRAAPDDVVLCPDSDAILVRTNESGL
jgi:uncharacterized protein